MGLLFVLGLVLAGVTSSITAQSIEMTVTNPVQVVGGEVTVSCRVPYVIESCRFTLGKQSFNLKENISYAGHDFEFVGAGFPKGECAIHILKVHEDWHGNVTCSLTPLNAITEASSSIRLIVAKPPKEPLIESQRDVEFKEGDDFTAQCVVPMGRPEAKISWLLDGEPLLSGLHEPVVKEEDNTDLKTISQRLTRTLTPDDNGRDLSCVARHEAWSEPRLVQQQLRVSFAPKSQDGDSITVFGLKLSEEGHINVTVRANPPPEVTWSVRDETLRPGHSDRDDNLRALTPVSLGKGYYNCSLLVRKLTKEDVEKQYYLNVSNSQGAAKLSVRISTMDEPAGSALDAGAVVGIVVAALALLLAVSLLVFAKATDRWCFAAGRRRDVAKSSGESTPAAGDVLLEAGALAPALPPSDTESASGGRLGRWKLSELRDRVRNALPRHKDKQPAADPPADADKVGEEKKGVVYAELALTEQPASKPAPAPPGAEYAEILYPAAPAADHN